jgi:hypothetical protein
MDNHLMDNGKCFSFVVTLLFGQTLTLKYYYPLFHYPLSIKSVSL